MSSSQMVFSGSSLMVGSGSPGGGGALADDLFFVPDDTHFVGYDSDGATWGRPRNAYFSRGLNIGLDATVDPSINFVSATGAAPAQTVNAYIRLNNQGNVQGIVTPFEIHTDNTANTLLLYSEKTPSSTDPSIVLAIDDANAASDDADRLLMVGQIVSNALVPRMRLDANATLYLGSGDARLGLGVVPAGLSADFGLSTQIDTDTLSLWSVKSTAAGAVSVAVIADTGGDSINQTHKILSLQSVVAGGAVEEAYFYPSSEAGCSTAVFTNGAGAALVRVGSVLSDTAKGIETNGTSFPVYVASALSSGVGNQSVIFVANVAAASINAAHKVSSWSWANAGATLTELGYFTGDGSLYLSPAGTLRMGLGTVPAGLSNDYGVSTQTNTDTLSLWGVKSNAASAVSVAIVADVNNATINADHKVLSIQWVNNSDTATELFAFKDGAIELTSANAAAVVGTVADGASAIGVTLGSQNTFSTAGAKLISVVNGDPSGVETFFVDYIGDVGFNKRTNGQLAQLQSLSELTTIAAAASTTTTIQIPADAIVFAVSVRVTVVIPTAATFDVGVSGATTRYGSGLSVAAGTTNTGTDDGMRFYSSAISITITPNLTPAANSGRVRVTIHYFTVTPPTS